MKDDISSDDLKILTAKEEQKQAVLELQKAKEKIFKLVVKIICWESGARGSTVLQADDKITEDEWQKYKKHRLKTFSSIDSDKGKQEVAQTYSSIKANGGFA